MSRAFASFMALGLIVAHSSARADEGMWTFDQFPTAKVEADLGWAPDKAWLDRVRLSSGRLENGCSAAIVSSNGLVQTNHHCVVSCVQNLSKTGEDIVRTGFLAATREQERVCPAMALSVLTNISDVTDKIAAATGKIGPAAFTKARDAAISAIEGACKGGRADRDCQVVSLYEGGQYKLYTYKRYREVRLVFAPEIEAAFFGGDPDNFNFPRYCLDAAYLRLYENGKPAATPTHYAWADTPLKDGDPVFVPGNPGSTSRSLTPAELAFQRDHQLPFRLELNADLRGRLIEFSAKGEEETRIASDTLFSVENSFKGRVGRRLALVDAAVFAQKRGEQEKLEKAIAADPALAASVGSAPREIADAMEKYRGFYQLYFFAEAGAGQGSDLYSYARSLVRAAAERQKPDAERLPSFTSSNLPKLEAQLGSRAPVEKPLEVILMNFWLSKAREYLTVNDPFVQAMLGKESPEALAARLVSGSKLDDPAERLRLFKGGAEAIAASTDPMIVFARSIDAQARAVRTRFEEEIEGPIAKGHERLAKARFALYGASLYPDATFTLRISYGKVAGWTDPSGRTVTPLTNFAGLAERASGAPPYKLAPSWAKAIQTLSPGTNFNVSTTNDIIGGNSGSPLVDKEGRVAGAVFDGNIHSLGGDYIYDARLNRTVAVASTAIKEALVKVYGAEALAAELGR